MIRKLKGLTWEGKVSGPVAFVAKILGASAWQRSPLQLGQPELLVENHHDACSNMCVRIGSSQQLPLKGSSVVILSTPKGWELVPQIL